MERKAKIQAQRANVTQSTLGLLSGEQAVFFEATATDTIFTDAIEAGATDDALLIRLLYKPDATTVDTCYIRVDEEDQAEDIAQAWSAILWGERRPRRTLQSSRHGSSVARRSCSGRSGLSLRRETHH
jgi:hypothetical protein